VSLRALRHCEAVNHAPKIARLASLSSLLGSLIGSLLVPACTPARTAETAPRPATAPASSPASSASSRALPFPDTAFQGDGTGRAAPFPGAPPSRVERFDRFETRRIGAGDDDGDARGVPSHFRGAPVDLDLKSADLADVFRLLADVGHVNIVVDGSVTGTVTLRLKHVPWDQALDLVARTHGLALEREGNVIVVGVSAPHAGNGG